MKYILLPNNNNNPITHLVLKDLLYLEHIPKPIIPNPKLKPTPKIYDKRNSFAFINSFCYKNKACLYGLSIVILNCL